jgi:hypothetical protein
MKDFSQNVRCPGRDLNRTSPENMSKIVSARPACSVSALYGTQKFFVLFRRVHHQSLSSARRNLALHTSSISVIYILILSFGLRTCMFPSVISSGFPDSILIAFLLSFVHVAYPAFA